MQRELFDTEWEYSEGVPFFGLLLTPTQPVALPHDASIGKPRSPDHPSGAGGGYAWNGALTYRKRVHAPDTWRDQRVQLEFEGVMMHAEVFVNGHLVTQHPYGYTSFLADLTPYLQIGAENEVMVIANNGAQPNSRWYTGTGIYRHVWLRTGPALHIAPWGLFVATPDVDPALSSVALATEIVNTTDRSTTTLLRTRIHSTSGALVAEGESNVVAAANTTSTARQQLLIPHAQLWSVDSPTLYTLVSELVVDGTVTDTAQTSFGIRSITVDPLRGLRLNGEPLKLQGGCVHHDHGLLGAASYDRAEERKVELMKSAGFNALRCAHNPPAPALLDACDRLGMLVINESFDVWRMGKTAHDYHLYFEEWWQRDTESMVKRDRNHPSVIMWSIGNEIVETFEKSDSALWSQRQAEFVRTLDPTRPVTQALRMQFEEMFSQATPGGAPGWNPEDAAPEDAAPEDAAEGGDAFDGLSNRPPPDPATESWGDLTETLAASMDIVGYNYLPHRYEYDREHFAQRVICGTETFPHHAYSFWEKTQYSPNVIGDFVWTALDYLGESGIGQVLVDQAPAAFHAPYPYHIANCGDFDICGFKRPQSYFRDILWDVRTAPYIGVLPPQYTGKKLRFSPWGWEPVEESWSFPGAEGQPVQVDVYSADEEVELLLNGESLGRQAAGAAQQNKASFQITYQPGTLEAVSYRHGRAVERTTLTTAGDPASLRLTPDRVRLTTTPGDLSYITVEIIDAEGTVVPHATHDVTIAVTGVGDLLALGTANPLSEESYVGTHRTAHEGRLMAVVRSSGQPGEITVRAGAEGLAAAEVRLTVRREA